MIDIQQLVKIKVFKSNAVGKSFFDDQDKIWITYGQYEGVWYCVHFYEPGAYILEKKPVIPSHALNTVTARSLLIENHIIDPFVKIGKQYTNQTKTFKIECVEILHNGTPLFQTCSSPSFQTKYVYCLENYKPC